MQKRNWEGDNKHHLEDRNWFSFYQCLLQLYKDHKKPIFTTLGNHDYVLHATAPWPLFGKAWNGVFDMNLTRYENALCFGEGFNNSKEFLFNSSTSVDCVKWYTQFINPFPDYVVDYGNQSMFMVDWGEKGVFPVKAVVDTLTGSTLPIHHPGTLHHAGNMFLDKNHAETTSKQKDYLGEETTITSPRSGLPFPIRNYSIYKSWIEGPATVKMLFTHATSICPRDDISVGEINTTHTWADDELRYGTFDHKRDEILQDVENGKLHIIVGGHSHRSLVMKVCKDHKTCARTIAAGETVRTELMEPSHIALVTSSGGPFPKYIPGGPLICACADKYNTGFYHEKSPINQLFSADDHTKTPLESDACPDCGMKGADMVRKPFRRHTPGGNLLIFQDGCVRIESVVADHNTIDPINKPTKPRKAVICEEHGVFLGDMRLEDIDSYKEYKQWKETKPVNIISEKPFTYYGYMEFPLSVQYVTFVDGGLPGGSGVDLIDVSDKTGHYCPVKNQIIPTVYINQ